MKRKLFILAVAFFVGVPFALAAPSFTIRPGRAILSGQNAIASAGTAEALCASTTTLAVIIQAHPDNTGDLYVGYVSGDVASNNGIVLEPGDAITIAVDDPAKIYVDAATSADIACYILIK